MRHTIKPLFGALLALLALAALTSTASAATCKKGLSEAEHKTLCVEGQQVGSVGSKVTTTAAFTQKAGTTAVLNAQEGWSVVCAHVKTSSAPTIKSGGSSEVHLENATFSFSECKVMFGGKEESACGEPIFATHTLSGSLASPESVRLEAPAEAFASLKIQGACMFNADYTINGYQVCSLKQPEVEAVAKELVCEPKNSHLMFGGGFGGPETLKIEGNLELAGTSKGKKYSITK